MTTMEERVRHLFGISLESQMTCADTMPPMIAKAGQRLVDCLLTDKKILLCGNGASAANCQHFSSAMINHFEVERPPLPVFALTTDSSVITGVDHDGNHEQIFARPIQALGQEGDILIVLTTSGNSSSILAAVNAAHDRGMDVIALSGRDGGILTNHLGPEDLELRTIGEHIAQLRETHLFILHCFCDLIDQSLFGSMLR